MKPNRTDRLQATKASFPAVAPMPPIEISTSAGTPLAIQNAPFQSIVRSNPCCPVAPPDWLIGYPLS